MSDDMARALGASGSKTMKIAGKDCRVRPLGLKDLAEVERDCVDQYKREYLRTFSKNLDLLPKEVASSILMQKLEEVAKWDKSNLPSKYVYDPRRVVVTKELKEKLNGLFDMTIEEDEKIQLMAAYGLDQGVFSEEEYKALTNSVPHRIRVPYTNWWITGSLDGMISMLFQCFANQGVTKDQILEATAGKMSEVVEVSRAIESLSSPDLGNG